MKNTFDKSANNIWINLFRITSERGSAHIGSCFSCVDKLIYLYSTFLNVNLKQADLPNRDFFIMSKGHLEAGRIYYLLIKKLFEYNSTITNVLALNSGSAFLKIVGSQEYLRREYKIDYESINRQTMTQLND